MTNGMIFSLVNGGILGITSNDLPRNDEGNKAAYRVYKFKKAIEKAFKELQESEKGLVEAAGIEDANAFDQRRLELRENKERTEAEDKEFKELNDKMDKYISLKNELYNEDVTVECLPISWPMWRLLLEENKAKKVGENEVDLLSPLESLLEGILWEGAEE